MDTGNTAWILMSAAMVLLMTPGLAFFYGGLVRERQVINTRRHRRLASAGDDARDDSIEYASMLDAYLVQDFAALYEMECERDGIDPGSG